MRQHDGRVRGPNDAPSSPLRKFEFCCKKKLRESADVPRPPFEIGPVMARKIAFFTHYSELYGANLSLLNLIEGLIRFGIEAHVIGPEPGDLFDTLARRGIPNL